jgi:hypothetical protein
MLAKLTIAKCDNVHGDLRVKWEVTTTKACGRRACSILQVETGGPGKERKHQES